MSTNCATRIWTRAGAAAIVMGFLGLCLLASPANADVVNIYSADPDGTIYHLFPPSTVTGTFPLQDLIVGATTNADYVGIAFFQLPDLQGGAFSIDSASLKFTTVLAGKMTNANGDIWGLGYLSSPPAMSTSWHLLADSDAAAGLGVPNRTKIADNIVPLNTALTSGQVVQTNAAQNATLRSFLNSLYMAGAGPNDYAVIRFNPDASPNVINDQYRFGGSHRGTSASLLTVNLVPEPGTIVLALSCLVGLAPLVWWRRRR